MSDADAPFDPSSHRPGPTTRRRAMWAALLLLVVLVALGIVPRWLSQARERQQRETSAAIPARVHVVKAQRGAVGDDVPLPGSVEPVQETTVYARTSGYVNRYFVDIGDAVRGGQPLVELEVPDVQQELRQAEAQRQQAAAMVEQTKTQRELARATAERYRALSPSGVVSTQEYEERQAALAAHEANVNAALAALGNAEANLRRLKEIESFATVRAPFDGVVTSRTMEKGQLVVAGTGNGQPVCKVAKMDVVRVFVNVPQLYASGVQVDSAAPTRVREFGARVFAGKVTRTARELDPLARTLLTEVRIANDDGTLLAGMYAQVTLHLARHDTPLRVPSTALLMGAAGARVALVQDGKIRWRKVEVESDLGAEVAIASGVAPGDDVVTVASERLHEGLAVQVEQEQAR